MVHRASVDKIYSTTHLLAAELLLNTRANDNAHTQWLLREGGGRKGHGGLRTRGYFKNSLKERDGSWCVCDANGQPTNPIESSFGEVLNELPLITVITVVFNGEKYIDETIQSVIGQSYPNVEYIIIDGGSSDSTLEIIRKYDHAIDYWVSENDDGIYDAMNKGINLSLGEWIYFLGADDRFYDNGVIEAIEKKIKHNGYRLVFGKVISDIGKIIISTVGNKLLLHNTLHHQACFYNKSLFQYNRYDTSLKLISDYELNLIAYLDKSPFCQVDQIIAMCRDGGVSTSRSNYFRFVSETNIVRNRHVNWVVGKFLTTVFLIKAYLHYAVRYL